MFAWLLSSRIFARPNSSANSPHSDDGGRPKVPVEERRYAVFTGYNPGIYMTWGEVQAQTDGVPGQAKRMFPSEDKAKEAFEQARASGAVKQARRNGGRETISKENLEANVTFEEDSISSTSEHFYAVICGRQVGVYRMEPTALVAGVSGASCVRFKTFNEACVFFKERLEMGQVTRDTTEWQFAPL